MKEGKDKSVAICNGWKEAAFWSAGAGELGWIYGQRRQHEVPGGLVTC